METKKSVLILYFSFLFLSACSDVKSNKPPEGLTITVPATTIYVRLTAVTFSGECLSGATVNLKGPIQNSPVTTPCTDGAYSASVTLTAVQGNKVINVSQTASDGTTSNSIARTVVFDTTAPGAPTITAPTNNVRVNLAGQTIRGGCETGATIRITGNVMSPPVSTTCLNGFYAGGVTFIGADGTKNYSVTQTDRAGNASTATARSLILDTTDPIPPTITNPATNVTVNSFTQTIGGGCETNATIIISGAILNAPLQMTCGAGGTYSRSISLVSGQGNKIVSVSQRDVAGNLSTTSLRTFLVDTITPSAPTITSPIAGARVGNTALTVTGGCEYGATVTVAGTGVVSAQTVVCPSGRTYSRSVILTSGNGTKALRVTQRDAAGNTSAAIARNITLGPATLMPASLSKSRDTASLNFRSLRNTLQDKHGVQLSQFVLNANVFGEFINEKCDETPLLNLFIDENQQAISTEDILLGLVQMVLNDEVSEISGTENEKLKAIFNENNELTPLGYYALFLYSGMNSSCFNFGDSLLEK